MGEASLRRESLFHGCQDELIDPDKFSLLFK